MRRISSMSLFVLGLVLACSRKMEGPTPSISTTLNEVDQTRSPAVVCNAQGDPTAGWLVDIMGDNFSPIPQNVLGDTPGTMLPTVSLSGPGNYSFSPDRVFFSDKTKLVIQMPTRDTASPFQLSPGSYRLTVSNPDGATAQLDGAITIVPPPQIATVTVLIPPLPTSDGTIALDGTNFEPGTTPKVVISGPGLPTVQLVNVTVVNATRVTATVPANTPEGIYDVTITNPDGCAFTLPRVFTISYNSLGLLALDPRFGWQLKNQGITIYNSPTGAQKTFSGGAPQAWIVAPLKTNPAIAVEIPLRRVAYLSPTVITAAVPDCSGMAATPITDTTCPNGIQPGGPYPIKVRDPNGAVGVIPAVKGFWVLTDPPPVITSIAPATIDTRGLPSSLGSALAVTGQNFGAGAQLELLFPTGSGNIEACSLTATGGSSTSIQAPVPTSLPASSCVVFDSSGNQSAATTGFTLAVGLYVVRVQNTTNPAYADYSGLIVTNPSLNPSRSDISTTLSVARADFPLVQASDDLGNQYLYALGGTDGANALSSVEVAPLTLFGDLGGDCSSPPCKFRLLERTQIGVGNMGNSPQPRRGMAAVVRTIPGDTSYIYLIGGVNSTGTALKEVERAQVLKAADAPSLLTPDTTVGGSLAAGTYYYRVSAIEGAANALNPGGETLASDEQPITINTGAQVVLSWTCLPGVQKYRIYRTASANGVSGTELLLTEVNPSVVCSGSPLPVETYNDSGGCTCGGDKPLPAGALGRWVTQSLLTVERGNAAAKLLGDQLYVAGGFCSTFPATGCSAPGADLASVDRASFAAGSAALGSFSDIAAMQNARRRFALTIADALTAPSSFSSPSPDNRNDAWLVAVGGDSAGAVITSGIIEVGQVQNSSGGIPSPIFSAASYNTLATHGGWSEIVGNDLFEAGTTASDQFSFKSHIACPGTGGQVGQCTSASSFTGTLNDTGISYLAGGSRYLGGETLFRAYIYVAGGFPNEVPPPIPSASIERLVY